jgi:hypothetical protein
MFFKIILLNVGVVQQRITPKVGLGGNGTIERLLEND